MPLTESHALPSLRFLHTTELCLPDDKTKVLTFTKSRSMASPPSPEQDLLLQSLPTLFSETPVTTSLEWSYLDLCADAASCVTDTAPPSASLVSCPAESPPCSSACPDPSVAAVDSVVATATLDSALLFPSPDAGETLWETEAQAHAQTQIQAGEQTQHQQHQQYDVHHQVQNSPTPGLFFHQTSPIPSLSSDQSLFPPYITEPIEAQASSDTTLAIAQVAGKEQQAASSCSPAAPPGMKNVLSPMSAISASSRAGLSKKSVLSAPGAPSASTGPRTPALEENEFAGPPCRSAVSRHSKLSSGGDPIPRRSRIPAAAHTSSGVAKSAPTKQRRRYNQPRSSKYCHLCARHERAVPMVPCGNFFRGLCQKSVCRKCFATYGLDWEAARASLVSGFSRNSAGTGGADETTLQIEDSTVSDVYSDADSATGASKVWLCPHCLGSCPKRAKCFAYDRQTVRRRVKTQEARLHANESVAVTL